MPPEITDEPAVPEARNGGPESYITFPRFPLGALKIGQLGTGFDDDRALGATEEAWGGEAGGAGVPRRDASGPQAPAARYAEHVGDMRQGRAELQLIVDRVRLEQQRDEAEPKARLARLKAESLSEDVEELARARDAARADDERLRADVASAEQEHRALSRSEQGIVYHWSLPVLIAVAVSTIDVGVLHLAFGNSNISDTDVWLNAIAIPVAMLGMMFAFGWLAGMIALKVPSRRRLLAGAATLGLALVTLFVGLALLTYFRDVAVDAHNRAFDALARGDATNVPIGHVVKTTFLGFLQAAAVWAGMIAEALYVMGKPGRDAQRRISELEDRRKAAQRRLAAAQEALDACRREERGARLEAEMALVEGARAAAELRSLDDRLAAEHKAIRGAADAAAARYETERQIAEQKARNGTVRLASRRTEEREGILVTRGPVYADGAPDAGVPSPNGNEPRP